MFIKRFFKDLNKYKKYLVYSTKATLKSEVSDSYLAWFWWILEPFCFMLIYTFIADVVFKKSMPYASLFVFLGLTVWNFFNRNIASSATLLKANKGIITKIYLPKYLVYIRYIMVNGFKMCISFIMCFVLVVVYRVPIDWHIIYVIPSIAMLVLVTFGLGCLFMHLGVYVQDFSKILKIVLRLVFYLSGVFFDMASSVPHPYGELLLNANPAALAMEGCRNALIYQKSPDWLMLGIWTAVGLILSIFSVVLVYKKENNYGKIL